MKIAFESQLFLKGNKTGIAWCADNIIKQLSSEEECQCNYFSLHYPIEKIKEVREYEEYGVKMKACTWFHDILYKLVWPIIPLPYSMFFGKDSEITQFFNCVVPPGVKGKSVVIIHDMAYKVCPETVREKTKRWLQLTLKGSCKRATAIVTVSEASKRDIIKYIGVEPEKITVMPNGVNLQLFNNNYSNDEIERVKEKYKINGEYFLYLGTLEPRKNIPKILHAYRKFLMFNKENNCLVPQLVISGGKGWLYNSIFETVKDLKLEDYVIFTGYVENLEVPKLMNGALAFVYPSLYEGFGMPLLEAMACGTPVITSNTSSLPEVADDAGILVNPDSDDEICEAMKKIKYDEEFRSTLISKGLKRVELFTWENSATILHNLYKKLLE